MPKSDLTAAFDFARFGSGLPASPAQSYLGDWLLEAMVDLVPDLGGNPVKHLLKPLVLHVHETWHEGGFLGKCMWQDRFQYTQKRFIF